MHWQIAVKLARRMEMSYEEWCNLYYKISNPTEDQIRLCSETAKTILVREGMVKSAIVITR